jgi:hypothetical protein
MSKIAFLGLGEMGAPMASRLRYARRKSTKWGPGSPGRPIQRSRARAMRSGRWFGRLRGTIRRPWWSSPASKKDRVRRREVVSVASHETPAVGDREAKLLLVREAPAVDLVHGDDIEAETSPDLGRRGVQILALIPQPITVLQGRETTTTSQGRR